MFVRLWKVCGSRREERREERAEGCGMTMMLVVNGDGALFSARALVTAGAGKEGPSLSAVRRTDAAGKRRRRHSPLGGGQR